MTDAPETIWALYAPEVGEDHPQCTIVAGDEPIYGAMQYTRTDHSQALVAAAYEAAGEHLNWQWYPDEVAWAVRGGATEIVALTPADAQAALDRLIADAERRGMERAAEICTGIIKNYNVMKPDGTTYESLKVQKAAKGMVSLAREDIRAAMEDKRGTNKEGYGNEK
jgi:hypothetical protein